MRMIDLKVASISSILAIVCEGLWGYTHLYLVTDMFDIHKEFWELDI